MQLHSFRHVSFRFVVLLATLGGASAQSPTGFQPTKLVSPDPRQFDRFGGDVLIEGDLAIVGAYIGDGGVPGYVCIWRREASGWQLEQKLEAADGAPFDHFSTLALQGPILVVGAYGTTQRSGRFYEFERVGTTWIERARVESSGALGDGFGCSLALSGNTLAVGASSDGELAPGAGAVHVFVRGVGGWTEQARLTASDPGRSESFGRVVALEGDTLVVGAPGIPLPGYESAAYLFTREGTTWTEVQRIEPTPRVGMDEFGAALALEQDLLVVAAPDDAHLGLATGAIYAFARAAGGFVQTARIEPADAVVDQGFGDSVALDAGRIVVGAIFDPDLGQRCGAAYVFEPHGSGWKQAAKFETWNVTYELGDSVDLSGDQVLVGSSADSEHGLSSGAAFVFSLPPDELGSAFCFGDGSGAACPCGAPSAPGAGRGCANSIWPGARLVGTGTSSASVADVRLVASFVAPHLSSGRQTFLLGSRGRVDGSAILPFSSGLVCLGGSILRDARALTVGEHVTYGPAACLSSAEVGRTRYFQVLYEDLDPQSPCAARFNTTNAYALRFTP